MFPRKNWKYLGFPGHFCEVHNCRFRLCTDVGEYRISTVGALYRERDQEHMSEIGSARHYETYVFGLVDGEISSLTEIDSDGIFFDHTKDDPYEADKRAEAMHDKMCLKYARIQG